MVFNNSARHSPIGQFICIYSATGREPISSAKARKYFEGKGIRAIEQTVSSPAGTQVRIFTSLDLEKADISQASRVTLSFGINGHRLEGESDLHGGQATGTATFGSHYSLSFDIADGSFEAWQGELSHVQLWYIRHEGGFAVSNDLRCLRSALRPSLDEHAARLLLVYQSLPPSLSLFHGIQGLPALHKMRITSPDGQPKIEALPVEPDDSLMKETDLDACSDALARAADHVLDLTGNRENFVSFSGGIDSAYITCRLKELGTRCTLVHYSFDLKSRETLCATQMASLLDFPLFIIDASKRNDAETISSIGRDWDYPFGDLGTITSAHLSREMANAAQPGAVVWDGTAADGLLAISAANHKWHRLHKLPRPILTASAKVYERGLWQRQDLLEYVMRTIWRAAYQPFPFSSGAIKLPFAGIVTRIAPEEQEQFRALYERYVFPLFYGEIAATQQREIVGTFHRSARQIAPKAASPLMSSGYLMLFPFMSRSLLSAALSIQPAVKYSRGTSKPILTSKLAGHVGRELPAMPKAGFSPRNQSLLESKAVLEALNEELVSQNNPLNELINLRLMHKALRLVTSSIGIDTHVHKALWTYLFTSLWLRG